MNDVTTAPLSANERIKTASDGLRGTIALGLTPFLIGDAIKIAAAAGLLPLTWKGLRKAGLTS